MDLGVKISKRGRNYYVTAENEVGWNRRLSELAKDDVIFDRKEAEELIERKDAVIYKVINLWKFNSKFEKLREKTGINCDITVMNHGIISTGSFGELYLTYGHVHLENYGEVYSVVAGKAFLIFYEPKSLKTTVVKMSEGSEFLIPKGTIHRLYCGSEGAVIVGLVSKKAGHDYGVVKGKGFPYHIFFNKENEEVSYLKNERFGDARLEVIEAKRGLRFLRGFLNGKKEVISLLT
jgi:glucose-6-phosphate isomerase